MRGGIGLLVGVALIAGGCTNRGEPVSTPTTVALETSSTVAEITDPNVAQSVELANGVTLIIEPGAVTAGATIRQTSVTAPSPLGTVSGTGDPVKLTVEGGKIIAPVTLEFPYDPAVVPAGLKITEIASVVTAADETVDWESVIYRVDEVRHVLIVSTTHFSIWDWLLTSIDAAFGWLQQGIGQMLGNRAGPPLCGHDPGRGLIPDWVAQTVTDSTSNMIVRSCAEGEGDAAVIEMVNNRAYPMVLTYGAPVSWGWHDSPSSLGAQFATSMIESSMGPNSLVLPPLSRASIGVPRGDWFSATFNASPTRLTAAAMFISLFLDNIGGWATEKITASMGGECVSDHVIGNVNGPVPDSASDLGSLFANVADCFRKWLEDGGLTELARQGARVGELDAAAKALKVIGLATAGAQLGGALTPVFDLLHGDKGLWPSPMTIRRKTHPEPTAPSVIIPLTAPPQVTVAPTTPAQVTTAPPQVTVAPTTSPQDTVAPTTAPPITNPPAPQPVTLYNTIGIPAHGEFLCSSNNANGSSWGIQTFTVPGNARFVSKITVGVGGRDGFTISLRRGGQELAGVRLGAGLDENIPVDVGRVAVTPGETLELWVGDGAGWTNYGSRSASRVFNVVATNADGANGSYRTTNNCPVQAPGAQTLPGDISASITGWDS